MILITINGNREIPMDVSPELLEKLSDFNTEVEIKLIASPTGQEIRFEDGELQTISKIKVVRIDSIITANVG